MGGRRYPHLMDPDLDPVRSVLRRLTDRERRESIDAELVRDLDEHVQKRKARQSYGEEGRDVGEKDTADEHMAPPPDWSVTNSQMQSFTPKLPVTEELFVLLPQREPPLANQLCRLRRRRQRTLRPDVMCASMPILSRLTPKHKSTNLRH